MATKLESPPETVRPSSQWKSVVRRIAWALLALVVLWAVAGYVATIPIVGNHAYWRTLRAQPSDFGLHAEDVSFFSRDHIRLIAWFIASSRAPHGTVILAHGIDGNRSDMLPRATFLLRGGYNALLVDCRFLLSPVEAPRIENDS